MSAQESHFSGKLITEIKYFITKFKHLMHDPVNREKISFAKWVKFFLGGLTPPQRGSRGLNSIADACRQDLLRWSDDLTSG